MATLGHFLGREAASTPGPTALPPLCDSPAPSVLSQLSAITAPQPQRAIDRATLKKQQRMAQVRLRDCREEFVDYFKSIHGAELGYGRTCLDQKLTLLRASSDVRNTLDKLVKSHTDVSMANRDLLRQSTRNMIDHNIHNIPSFLPDIRLQEMDYRFEQRDDRIQRARDLRKRARQEQLEAVTVYRREVIGEPTEGSKPGVDPLALRKARAENAQWWARTLVALRFATNLCAHRPPLPDVTVATEPGAKKGPGIRARLAGKAEGHPRARIPNDGAKSDSLQRGGRREVHFTWKHSTPDDEKHDAAEALAEFLRDYKRAMHTGLVVADFLRKVRSLQRVIRNYLQLQDSRLVLLTLQWSRVLETMVKTLRRCARDQPKPKRHGPKRLVVGKNEIDPRATAMVVHAEINELHSIPFEYQHFVLQEDLRRRIRAHNKRLQDYHKAEQARLAEQQKAKGVMSFMGSNNDGATLRPVPYFRSLLTPEEIRPLILTALATFRQDRRQEQGSAEAGSLPEMPPLVSATLLGDPALLSLQESYKAGELKSPLHRPPPGGGALLTQMEIPQSPSTGSGASCSSKRLARALRVVRATTAVRILPAIPKPSNVPNTPQPSVPTQTTLPIPRVP